MLVVVDYGRGNLFSIGQALHHLGVKFVVSDNPVVLRMAKRVILPGVGGFGDAIESLKKGNLLDPLRGLGTKDVPLLGICLGMQLLVDCSEEFGKHEGLGLISGTVKRLPKEDLTGDASRIPNVGWRTLHPVSGHSYLDDLPANSMFYFVHSFAAVMDDPADTIGTINFNGHEISAVIQRNVILGCQFHPEKSGPLGLELLKRFVELPV